MYEEGPDCLVAMWIREKMSWRRPKGSCWKKPDVCLMIGYSSTPMNTSLESIEKFIITSPETVKKYKSVEIDQEKKSLSCK